MAYFLICPRIVFLLIVLNLPDGFFGSKTNIVVEHSYNFRGDLLTDTSRN